MAELGETIQMENSNEDGFELCVKQGEPALVPPAEKTEKGLYFLSNLDQNIAVTVQTVYCFKADDKGNERAAEVIKEALAKVLVHYYPLAGRLTISSEGKLIVNCTGEGAVFVEADANCTMERIGDITKPDPCTLGKLVYNIPSAKKILETPPLLAQVCQFHYVILINIIFIAALSLQTGSAIIVKYHKIFFFFSLLPTAKLMLTMLYRGLWRCCEQHMGGE